MDYDVAIIGGGPGGSTAGSLLKKYSPKLKVLILEREKFPRDHVGESQLPVIGGVLSEMGVWDKVERANFPIKIGATYRWGVSDKLWNFEFLEFGNLTTEPRPAKYVGQRTQTAFQVDRAVYDDILLDHAAELGCEVRQETAVREVLKGGDRVDGLLLSSGDTISARHYIDASGHSGLLRRAMGVESEYPTTLQNIAIWDYWQNAEWAVSVGVGGTRVQVMSLGYGWLWFIPLGPTRTSVGLVVPASYYKQSGKRPKDLYEEAIWADPVIAPLIAKAQSEEKLTTTRDWSFLAGRLSGENWFLVGESAGFADPILAAGLTLTHMGARDAAYTILELERGEYEEAWLRERYSDTHRWHITNHIRFADFWYTHNGQFTDLQECAKEIAGDMGLELTPQQAWQWLGTGGFIENNSGTASAGAYGFSAAKHIIGAFLGERPHYEIVGKTHFRIDLDGAQKGWTADLANGRIYRSRCYLRGKSCLPYVDLCRWIATVLKEERSFDELRAEAVRYCVENRVPEDKLPAFRARFINTLEALVNEGWVVARTVPGAKPMPEPKFDADPFIRLDDQVLEGRT